MKKILYSVLAIFMMSVAFVSCKDSKALADKEHESETAAEETAVSENASPVEKLISTMGTMVAIMKDTHIKSAEDLTAFAEKLEGVKAKVEEATNELTEYQSKLTPEDAVSFAASFADFEKRIDAIVADCEVESDRLGKEAEAVGLDISEFEDLF